MNSSIKQIYVSLEISDNKLRMLVAEYFNTRFNILRVDSKKTQAISDFKVIDKEQLSKDIKDLADDISSKLGAKIEKVILVLPAYNFKRYPLRSSVVPENSVIEKTDIIRAINNSLKVNVDADSMVVNPMITKYTINGISSRRIPEKDTCDEMFVDIDLLCADRQMCFEYVSCVENAGLNVLDITLNTYAIAKEASLFEESLKQNLIILDIENTCTYLSLLSKGRMVSNELLFDGVSTLVRQVKLKYDIPEEDISKLLKFDVDFESEHLDNIVYAYNENGKTKTISLKELNEVSLNPIDLFADKLVTMCKPILEQDASIFITGEGQLIEPLVKKIKELSNVDVRSYYPDTIGVRDPELTAIYGSLFAYKDKVLLNNLNVTCIDLLQYDSYIDQKQIDSEGETITTKIKNFFKQYVEGKGGY